MIDSHTHLDMVPGEPEAVVAAALEAGVTKMLTVGIDEGRSRTALDHAARFEGTVFAAVGLHPNSSAGFDPDRDGAWIADLAADPRCRAIGEVGVDLYRDRAPQADQERGLRFHAQLARELDKPLVIHTRAADHETLAALADCAQGVRVILHCFSMPDRLQECIARGYWVSFAGNVTYPSATDLADAAVRAPLERLLVETDAPYLTPQVVRKQRNQPAFVAHTARFVAERRGIDYAELERAVHANAAELFGW